MKHKYLVLALILLLGLLQFRLWSGKNSVTDYQTMRAQIENMKTQNEKLVQRNQLLRADIDDLKSGLESVEERARNELGLIRKGETFYRIVPKR